MAKEAILATVWDAGHEVRETKLIEIAAVRVRAAKSRGSEEIGTVVCRRSVNFWAAPIYEIKFELIEHPQQVERLIREGLAEERSLP